MEMTTASELLSGSSRSPRPNIPVVDITSGFALAALRLANGTLIKDEALSLFEAVSAIEIGDAKMDSGTVEAGESLDVHYDPTSPLMPEEGLWLMDELLCCEVAWHMGYPLSQTLFTSVHINKLLWPDPRTLVDARFGEQKSDDLGIGMLHVILRSYCLALIKACDLVRSKIVSQQFYEVISQLSDVRSHQVLTRVQEEDFTIQLFHRELLHRFNTREIYAALDEAESWLETTSIPVELKNAMRSRLKFRRDVLRMLEACDRVLETRRSIPFTSTSMLHDIEDSTILGKAVTAAFSVRIQRDLASSVPPKPIVVVARQPAFAFMTRWFADAGNVFELLSSDTADDLLQAYWFFMSQDPQPSVYIRSLVQSFVANNDKILGRWQLQAFVLDDLRRLVIPGIAFPEPLHEDERKSDIASVLLDFARKAGEPYLNIFRSYCLNRCRTRRTLCHAIVDWDQLQVEAEEYDELLQSFTRERPQSHAVDTLPTYSYPLSSWVYHYKLMQMQMIAQLDFELSVYAHDEMAQMYWYICHLSSVHLLHLDRISFFNERLLMSKSRGGSSLPYEISLDSDAKFRKTLKDLVYLYTKIKGTEELARALHCLYVFLMRHHVIQRPRRPYASDKLRHELRMKPFLHVSIPDPPTSDELMEQSLLANLSDDQLLSEAGRASTGARRAWEEILKTPRTSEPASQSTHAMPFIDDEWTKDIKNTIRSCIAADIATSALIIKLKTGLIQHTHVQIPISVRDGARHPRWIVPKIA